MCFISLIHMLLCRHTFYGFQVSFRNSALYYRPGNSYSVELYCTPEPCTFPRSDGVAASPGMEQWLARDVQYIHAHYKMCQEIACSAPPTLLRFSLSSLGIILSLLVLFRKGK
jgi:hypothetical protein